MNPPERNPILCPVCKGILGDHPMRGWCKGNCHSPVRSLPKEEIMTSMTAETTYTLAELEAFNTLVVGQADDLKLEDGDVRVWLSRCTVEDGEPYDNKVTVEQFIDGRWVETRHYQAR